MRQVIQFLLGKFGAHHNAEINSLVSNWYSKDFKVKDVDVSLRDVSQGALIRSLEHSINVYGLSMDELKDLAVLPCLSDSKCDLKVRIYPLSNLIMAKLTALCAIKLDSWSCDDDVAIRDAAEHIVVTKNGFNPSIEGMYLNGTTIEGQEPFSVYLNKDEINGVIDFTNNTLLNGVEICDFDLLMKIVERSLLYRMIDSPMGFNMSMEEPELFEMVKMMVASQCDSTEATGMDPNIYSSWGERIGIAYTRFDITDIKKAKENEAPTKKTNLRIVVDNDQAEMSAAQEANTENLEYCEEWGSF